MSLIASLDISNTKARRVTNVEFEKKASQHRDVREIRRKTRDDEIYDLTALFIEEYSFFPFGAYKDLIDAVSRIYDIEATEPWVPGAEERQLLEPEMYVDS